MQWKPLERASSYFMANILLGIQTHERNIISRTTNVLNNLVLKGAVGAPLRPVAVHNQGPAARSVLGRSRARHHRRRVHHGRHSPGDAWFTLRHGFSEEALNEMLTDMSQLRVARKEFGGGLANPLNVPGRALEAIEWGLSSR